MSQKFPLPFNFWTNNEPLGFFFVFLESYVYGTKYLNKDELILRIVNAWPTIASEMFIGVLLSLTQILTQLKNLDFVYSLLL